MSTIIFGIIVGTASFLSLKAIGLPACISIIIAIVIAIWIIIVAMPKKPDYDNKKMTQR